MWLTSFYLPDAHRGLGTNVTMLGSGSDPSLLAGNDSCARSCPLASNRKRETSIPCRLSSRASSAAGRYLSNSLWTSYWSSLHRRTYARRFIATHLRVVGSLGFGDPRYGKAQARSQDLCLYYVCEQGLPLHNSLVVIDHLAHHHYFVVPV